MSVEAYTDYFGFLPVTDPLEYSGGRVTLLPEFEQAREWMIRQAGTHEYVYPSPVHTMRSVDGGKTFKKVRRSDRPAFLYRLPESHELVLDGGYTEESARYGEAAFVVHFLAFMYGYRCHFWDWWI